MYTTTLEQRVNERFDMAPVDIGIERPLVLNPTTAPATATPVVVAVVAVRLVAVEVLTMIARRYQPF